MKQLSESGIRALDAIARQHGFSGDAVLHMYQALMRSEGRMAQFSHQEFGGPGQWMTGGMTMIGDMFNDQLKGRVDRLCQSLRTLQINADNFVPDSARTNTSGAVWWPAEFGIPTSSGSQNHSRYAYFGQTQRLVVDSLGKTTIYDTRGHAINGFSQQQSDASAATFETDAGPIDLSRLPVVAAENQHISPTGSHGETSSTVSKNDIFDTIKKLGELRSKGLLSEQEFEQKKTELLGRL
jgi:hypothetical protein